MRKLPIGIQSFENLRKDNYLYVDKTKYIWELSHTGKVYFLSRPRRFGKSLLLSTIEAYFEGKKELFSGLEIESLEDESDEPWTEYPIIYMSFAMGDYSIEGTLEQRINSILREFSSKYGVEDHTDDTFGDRLFFLIKNIKEKTGKDVVVLVDEYDKPLLENHAVNKELEDKNRRALKGYYGALKEADKYLKFVFITGVTKFSKVSIFSDLNQLNDISLNPNFSGICGITEDEMAGAFEPEIKALSKEMQITFDECVERLRTYYDGYHFSNSGVGVYNPFSLLNAFFDNRIGMYWFATGTPTFLVKEMGKNDYSLQDLSDGVGEDADIMTSPFYDEFDFIQLLYQSGYLTIIGYDPIGIYKLGFPNHEVEYGFEKSLIPYVLSGNPNRRIMLIDKMLGEIRDGDIDSFMTEMKSLFASIPYPEGQEPFLEREWRNQMYLIFKIMGQRVLAEVHSSTGRCDAVVEMRDAIYIFEFKQDKTAEEALSQIDEKGYVTPYLSSGKKIIKIGANFSTEIRTIDEWKVVEGN